MYLSFLLLNFRIVSALMRKESTGLSIGIVILVFAVLGGVLGIADMHARNYVFTRF